MKRAFAWFGKQAGKAVVILLVIVLLPYAARLAEKLLPDLTRQAMNSSVIISEKISGSARLETNYVEQQGILTSSSRALFLGEVRNVQISYTYTASVGIDLKKVQIRVSGNQVILQIPPLEILEDDLTPTEVIKGDFWYPLTEKQRSNLLADEKTKREEELLAEMNSSDEAWQNTVDAIQSTVGAWLEESGSSTTVTVEKLEDAE